MLIVRKHFSGPTIPMAQNISEGWGNQSFSILPPQEITHLKV